MNAWELFLILCVALVILAAKYGFDVELMLRDRKTLLTVLMSFVLLYIGFVVLLQVLR